VIEIVTLPLSPQLKADHSLLQSTADTLTKQPGCKKISWGVLVEDENTGVLFVEWDKIDDHFKFMKDSIYEGFVGDLLKLLSGPPKIIHVPFKPFPPGPALNGPIVEFTQFYPKKEPGAKEEMEKITKDILDLADKHPKCHGTAVGPTTEDSDRLVLLLSWPTVEDHMEDYRKQKEFEPLGEGLGKVLTEVSIVHTKIIHLH